MPSIRQTKRAPPEPGLRLVYAGSAAFAKPALARLIAHRQWRIAGVYSQPARPAGRGQATRPSAVAELAAAHRLPLFTPPALTPEVLDEFAALKPDLLIVCAYGLLLPAAMLNIPKLGAVNLHASLLPRWRGAAPIQRAIAAGDPHTGMTLMRMAEALDSGPILAQCRTPITLQDTTPLLSARLAELAADLMLEHLPAFIAGQLAEQPQDAAEATYAHKLSRAEARIDWSQPAEGLARRIRAFNPWPGQQTELNGQIIRVWQAAALAQPADAPPGTIVHAAADQLAVACGDGRLRLEVLQRAGKRALPAGDFLRGQPLAAGDRLS